MIHYEATYKRNVAGVILASGVEPEPFYSTSGDLFQFKDVLDLLTDGSLWELNIELTLLSGDIVTLAMANREGMGTWVVTAFDKVRVKA